MYRKLVSEHSDDDLFEKRFWCLGTACVSSLSLVIAGHCERIALYVCALDWVVAWRASQYVSYCKHIVESEGWVVASVVVCALWWMRRMSDGFCCCIYRAWNLWNKTKVLYERRPRHMRALTEKRKSLTMQVCLYIRKARPGVVNSHWRTHFCVYLEQQFVKCWLWESAFWSVFFYVRLSISIVNKSSTCAIYLWALHQVLTTVAVLYVIHSRLWAILMSCSKNVICFLPHGELLLWTPCELLSSKKHACLFVCLMQNL